MKYDAIYNLSKLIQRKVQQQLGLNMLFRFDVKTRKIENITLFYVISRTKYLL